MPVLSILNKRSSKQGLPLHAGSMTTATDVVGTAVLYTGFRLMPEPTTCNGNWTPIVLALITVVNEKVVVSVRAAPMQPGKPVWVSFGFAECCPLEACSLPVHISRGFFDGADSIGRKEDCQCKARQKTGHAMRPSKKASPHRRCWKNAKQLGLLFPEWQGLSLLPY